MYSRFTLPDIGLKSVVPNNEAAKTLKLQMLPVCSCPQSEVVVDYKHSHLQTSKIVNLSLAGEVPFQA